MPFRIAKSFIVESGHILSKHPGSCRFPHGHSRTVEIVLVADTLDARDMVVDFKLLKQAVGAYVDRFDHSLAVNSNDAQFTTLQTAYGDRILRFEGIDPTSEVMAKLIFQHASEALRRLSHEAPADALYPVRPVVRVEKVRVTETASSWAEYWE
jgi:6-pyruvoyltetrahydropterin/6-carboxytetrahydropterin synthase